MKHAFIIYLLKNLIYTRCCVLRDAGRIHTQDTHVAKMNTKQQEVFSLVQQGHNVLLTGPAGTGKTYTMKHIIDWAHSRYKKTGVTASTGMAAYLLQGKTIHSFLGIGLGSKPASQLSAIVKSKNVALWNKLRTLDILIIDEISMIKDELLDKISDFLSIVRGQNTKPFGGVQMILCGDFCQLPPVDGQFCFQSDSWKKANMKICVLEELVRQSGDIAFQDMLQKLRWGNCTADILKKLKGLKNTQFQGVMPTKLYSVNVDVDKINREEFEALKNDTGAAEVQYSTRYSTNPNTDAWCKSIRVPENIVLCPGAQVMITWNMGPDLVNGTRCVVVRCTADGPVIRLLNGQEILIEYIKITSEDDEGIYCNFIPLRLAYAISIHKSQGMTLDAVEMDLGDSIFEYGQAYTALSRARSLDSVRITKVKASSFRTNPTVKKFYENVSI